MSYSEKKSIKILGLKKKSLNESKDYEIKMKPAPKIQIGDTVIYKKQKGYVIGAIGEEWIVQCQYSTYTAKSSELTSLMNKGNVYGLDQFKFDDKTQKVLFEQMVSCGIYMNNVAIKTQGCHVKFSDWSNAKPEDPIKILVEGSIQMMQKNNVRILEDINDFANPENYIEGVIIDESTGEAIESVMINVSDYTSSIGDAEMVRILRKQDGEPQLDTIPKALLSTLSV